MTKETPDSPQHIKTPPVQVPQKRPDVAPVNRDGHVVIPGNDPKDGTPNDSKQDGE